MTVSVEVFLTKVFIQVYLASLQKSDQDQFTLDTLCVADSVLEKFSNDKAHIESADLKSDNVGKAIASYFSIQHRTSFTFPTIIKRSLVCPLCYGRKQNVVRDESSFFSSLMTKCTNSEN